MAPPTGSSCEPFTRRVRAELAGETVIDTRDAAPAARDRHPSAPVRADRRRARRRARAERADQFCPFKGDGELPLAAGRRPRRARTRSGCTSIRTPDALAGGLRRRLRGSPRPLARRGRRGRRLPPRSLPPRRHPALEPDGARDRPRRDAARRDERAADRLGDRESPTASTCRAPTSWRRSQRSERVVRGPYMGRSTYWSTSQAPEIAWSYETPLDEVARLAGYVSLRRGGHRGAGRLTAARPHRLPARADRARGHLHPARRRHAARGAHLAARGRGRRPGPRGARVPAVPAERRHGVGRPPADELLRRLRLRRRARRHPRHRRVRRPAAPTSTPSRSRPTASRSSRGSPSSRGARARSG